MRVNLKMMFITDMVDSFTPMEITMLVNGLMGSAPAMVDLLQELAECMKASGQTINSWVNEIYKIMLYLRSNAANKTFTLKFKFTSTFS